MSDPLVRAGYRDRLHTGDVVYFVDEKRADDERPVQKGSVSSTDLADGTKRNYPFVSLWRELDVPTNGSGLNIAKSPRELFTEEEVIQSIGEYAEWLTLGEKPLDALVADPNANKVLAAVLGFLVMQRLAGDGIFQDPEYER